MNNNPAAPSHPPPGHPVEPQIPPALEQQITGLLDLTRGVMEADDLQTAVEALLQPMAEATGWCYGEVWLPDEELGALRSVSAWHGDDPALADFARSSGQLRFTSGAGLLGRAWQSRRAEWIPDIGALDPGLALSPGRALAAGLRSGFILPIAVQDGVLAILAFFARGVRPRNEPLIRLINLVAAQIGAAIQRLQAQAALRAREALLRSISDSALDAIVAIGPGGAILSWNPAAERAFGYSAPEVLGRPFELLLPAEPARGDARATGRLWREAGPQPGGGTFELDVVGRDGAVFPAEISIAAWRTGEGEGQTVIIRDISARRRAEAALRALNSELEARVAERTAALREANGELERAARLKDEFLANMSHELRTPLNTILTLTEAVTEGVYGRLNKGQSDALEAVSESGQQLLALINDILDLTRIESGKVELEIEPVEVEEICAASLRMVRRLAQAKGQRVGSLLDPSLDYVMADPRRLKQILVNLLANAIKFTPAGGQISIETRGDRAAGVLHFTVADTGIGIEPADIQRLFKPFVQLDGSLNRRHEGTGLGLAVVARLAELHGGGVGVSSAPGQGSRFTLSLPWPAAQVTGPRAG